DGQEKGREPRAEEVLGALLLRLQPLGAMAQRRRAEIEQEDAADRAQPILEIEQQVGDDGEPEAGDDPEDGVGARRAESRDEAEEAALEDRPPDAEHADRPDRDGDDHPDGDAFQEKDEQHESASLAWEASRIRGAASHMATALRTQSICP